jgi:hypothetical protein
VRGNHETPASADSHADDPTVPALNDVSRTERESEGLAAVPRGVELLAARDPDTHIVHDRRLTDAGLVARAHDDLFYQEVIGSRAEVWFYEWLLRHESRL